MSSPQLQGSKQEDLVQGVVDPHCGRSVTHYLYLAIDSHASTELCNSSPRIYSFTMKLHSLLLVSYAAAAIINPRATTWCDSFGSTTAGPYTIYHNNFGAGSATSGQQCTTFTSYSDNSVVWSTSWSWQGGSYNVKSYSTWASWALTRLYLL